MSYILDALRKAERDRHTQRTPNLDVPFPAPAKPAKPAQWFVVASLLIVILGLLLYIFLPNQKEDEIGSRMAKVDPVETDSSATSQIPQHLEQPAQQVESSIADLMGKQTFTRPTKNPKVTKRNEKTHPDSENTPATNVGKTAPKARQPVKTQKNKSLEQWNKVTSRPQVKNQKTIPANDQNQTQTQLGKNENGKIPWLNDLSPDFKRNLPVLNVNVFVYDENPNARFVVVNMRKFQPGQKITDNILLEDITPHSMVLKFADERFRIPRP